MKAFKAVYRYGKLYNTESGKRILLNDSARLSLIVEDAHLTDVDPYNNPIEGRPPDELLKEIQEKKYHSFRKIASANQRLRFNIRAGKNTKDGKRGIECFFSLKLLSDLYMVQNYKDTKHGVVYDCACVVESVEKNLLEYFEPIYAYSLNDAYMKTYDFYFALYGKPTVNVYNRFFIMEPEEKILALERMF